MSSFNKLNSVNVNDHVRKKNNLSYLPWAWAWGEVKKACSDAYYTIYENEAGLNYHHDGKTAWVKTGVTIDGIELIEYLPVMDFKNKSIALNNVTSFEVNKTIQRSLTKACARHGLGLYIYAGEDLPEDSDGKTPSQPKPAPQQKEVSSPAQKDTKADGIAIETICKALKTTEADIDKALLTTCKEADLPSHKARMLSGWNAKVEGWLKGLLEK
jgi:hypothetical protein